MERSDIISCPNCGAGNKAGSAVCRMCELPLAQPGSDASAQVDKTASPPPIDAQRHREFKQETIKPVDVQMINCPECNAENELGWFFCQQCGNKLPQTLPSSEPPLPQGIRTVASEPVGTGAGDQSYKTVEEETPPGPVSPVAPTMVAQPSSPVPPQTIKEADVAPPPAPKPSIPPPDAKPPMTEQVKSSPGASRPSGGITCAKCGHANEQGSAFCSGCGASLTVAHTMVMSSITAPPKGRLHLVMEGGQTGEVYEIGDETVIGRAQGDITFPHDGFMSGRHARVVRRGSSFVLTDEGSRNGTFIRIKGEVELKPGDMILIGKQLFRFEA
ncbi:MAG TPA: zinc ribbon domain-containing protein [Blastocatellia bacterium]|nr:zinc ribbon domain-containing protein [Blastocatellia bacterium]